MASETQTTPAAAAAILSDIANVLESGEDNPYRARNYRQAARLLLAHQPGQPLSFDGVLEAGPLRRKLEAIVEARDGDTPEHK